MTAPCGTNAGYHQHPKRGEKPCPACRLAHSRSDAERRYRHSPLHGTEAGIALHRSQCTPVCDACLDLAVELERDAAWAILARLGYPVGAA